MIMMFQTMLSTSFNHRFVPSFIVSFIVSLQPWQAVLRASPGAWQLSTASLQWFWSTRWYFDPPDPRRDSPSSWAYHGGCSRPGPRIHPNSTPIGSMSGIYANVWGILMVNVTIYTIHIHTWIRWDSLRRTQIIFPAQSAPHFHHRSLWGGVGHKRSCSCAHTGTMSPNWNQQWTSETAKMKMKIKMMMKNKNKKIKWWWWWWWWSWAPFWVHPRNSRDADWAVSQLFPVTWWGSNVRPPAWRISL